VNFAKKFLTATLSASIFLVVASPVRSTSAVNPKACLLSSGSWVNSTFSQVETKTFRVTFDATPLSSTMDAVTGLSSGPANAYTSLAAAVRFNLSGTIDTRNGGAFSAASTVPFTAGTTYHVILDVNVASHTYNAYVVVGGVQTILGMNLAFRTEQANVASLSDVGALSATGSDTICNIALTASVVAPAITTQPASSTVTAGQSANFSIATTGTAPLTYQWQKNGAAISGAASATYSTPVTSTADNGERFTAVVSNSAGTVTSSAATLTVKAPVVVPSITSQPLAQSVTAGQSASFFVASTGTAPLTYQWNRNGSAISGATLSSYATGLTTTSDNGAQFSVVVTNPAGSVTSSSALLTVKPAAPAPGCLLSSGSWVNSPLTQAQSGSFRIVFDATPASATMDSVAGLSSGSASAYTSLAASVRFNLAGTIDARNGGAFAASSAIPYVSGTNYHFILDVNIATHTYNAYVMLGSVQTTIGSNLAFRTEQATVASLNNFSALTATGSETICNIATSAAAATTPSISTQPASATVTVGKTATFSVIASGTATLTYQWHKNSAAVSGATSASYTTPATATSDNGAQFTVAVSNAAGTVTSGAASLNVTAPTTLMLNSSANSLSFGNVTVSSSSTQNVTLTNAGSANVIISQVMVGGAGFNATGANGTILSPGQSTTLTSTFAPSASGAAAGSITVSSNASNSPASISLSGTGVAAVSHSVALNWAPDASGATGYNTYSSAVSGGPYTKLTSASLPSTSYTDTTVQPGHTYYYVVTAVNSSNQESAYSGEVTALVP
jgi:hypothetical protein